MRRAPNPYRSFDSWPTVDRIAWEAAFTSCADTFEVAGAAAHLSGSSRLILFCAYADFLAFLSTFDPIRLTDSPAARLDRKIIEEYVKSQPRSAGGVTVATRLRNLRRVLW